MSALAFNLLLAFVGAFVVVGVAAVPALLQWPVPASQSGRRPVFAGPRVAGGGWS